MVVDFGELIFSFLMFVFKEFGNHRSLTLIFFFYTCITLYYVKGIQV